MEYLFNQWFEKRGLILAWPRCVNLRHLCDCHALFQAKALILKEPRKELDKYLDVPAFARGDLFYLLNLIETMEADGRNC